MKPWIPFAWLRIIITLGTALAAAALMLQTLLPLPGVPDGGTGKLLVAASISFVAIVGTVWVYWRFAEHRSWKQIGLSRRGNLGSALAGFSAGAAILSLGTLLLMVAGYLSFDAPQWDPVILAKSAVAMALVAAAEEILFRGYLITNLREQFSPGVSLVVSALIFTLAHFQNPSAGWMPLTVIFSGGLLLGIGYLHTGNLWFCMALHFAWNFIQGPILGFSVSGMDMEPVFAQNLQGPVLITGGKFGFEGSVLALLLNLAAFSFLARHFRKIQQGQTPELQ